MSGSWGGGRLSHSKHRKLPFHKRVPLSGDAKRSMLRIIASLRPPRVTTTEWFSTVREALRPKAAAGAKRRRPR